MKGIKGELSSLSITDLMQMMDMNQKSGVLFVTNGEQHKCFCFDKGKLILASARDDGLRFSDFLVKEGKADVVTVRHTVIECRQTGNSLISTLIDRNIMGEDFIRTSLKELTERNVMDVLVWEEGSFEFAEDLPVLLRDSPVSINAGMVVFEAVRKHDERMKKQGS